MLFSASSYKCLLAYIDIEIVCLNGQINCVQLHFFITLPFEDSQVYFTHLLHVIILEKIDMPMMPFLKYSGHNLLKNIIKRLNLDSQTLNGQK